MTENINRKIISAFLFELMSISTNTTSDLLTIDIKRLVVRSDLVRRPTNRIQTAPGLGPTDVTDNDLIR